MATISVSLRYHVETDTYYIQIKGAQYSRLNTQIRRITTYLGHIQDDEHTEERNRLAEQRRRLVRERRQAQFYVVIPASDIPENAHIRPLYDMPGQILTAEPEWYAELLETLQACQNKGDES